MDVISEKSRKLQEKLKSIAKKSLNRKTTFRKLEEGIKVLEKDSRKLEEETTMLQSTHFRRVLGWTTVVIVMITVFSLSLGRR